MVERINKGTKDELPHKGQKHSLLIALFSAKKDGRVATREELKMTLAEGNEDNHIMVTDSHLNVTVKSLRMSLKKIGSEYKIHTVRSFGFVIKGPSDT